MTPYFDKEWRRIRDRLRKDGPMTTSRHVAELVIGQDYPLAFSCRLIELLLKRGETAAAAVVLQALDQVGAEHPLLDELRSAWLWCTGRRRRASATATNSAQRWNRPYLYTIAARMHKLLGHHRKAAVLFSLGMDRARQDQSNPQNRYETK